MHITRSHGFNAKGDEHCAREDDDRDWEDDGDDGEDVDHEQAPGSDLQCPFAGCERVRPYTTRGNLVRHFQTRESVIFPLCGELI